MTVTVTIDARMPCAGTLDYVDFAAKQSNDFSSTARTGTS